ncbi:TfoX/Sxy family protein [Roseateles violae]|uniref:TfoX/Sxy family protein n=1 Tax=Roseateles violae TaxID=3058042 RepID=A0ABT8DXI9_9BURK|nr:TfoX/Sxy family protein [Pelomonas sp. PFR6]MDN3921361.1 TfoX/Sxy family protein [Pelomonas sp. PFR6]
MNEEFTAHCRELLSPLGAVRSRRMFGGHGLYVDELFIAIIAGEQLYLKTDAETRPRFEAAGCEPFSYDSKNGERVVMGYFRPPEEALESPALMRPWAALALQAALRARAAKAPVKRPRAPKPGSS